MNFLEAGILGVVEGLTEFLPISSTGHMILVSALLKLHHQEFVKTFEISIQLGAILAIVFLYARRLLNSFVIYQKLFVAFIPTAIVGLLLYKVIKVYLFNPVVVSIALILGGIVLVFLDKKMTMTAKNKTGENQTELENISYRNAFLIGVCQSVSVIPGVSRAAATIIGGVFNGLTKKQATEFSFLLAIPTMFAATGYDLLKTPLHLTSEEFKLLGFGSLVAFISAWCAVKLFLRFVEKYGFAYFGYYRIILGTVFLVYFYA